MKTVEVGKKVKKNLEHLNNIIMKYIYVIGLLVLFTSCNSVTNKIIKEYKKQISEKGSCIINISNIVDFKWDKMYVFEYGAIDENTLPKSVNDKLIYLDVHSNGFTRKLIFTLNDSVVYCERHSVNIEKTTKNEVLFDMQNTPLYKIYPKERAIFRVTREEAHIPYYYLQQIE